MADPGFDLGGAWTLSTGRGGRKSVKMLKVAVKVIIFACFGHISITLMLKSNLERSEQEKKRETLAFWAKNNHKSAAVRGRAPGAPPPPGPASVFYKINTKSTAIL